MNPLLQPIDITNYGAPSTGSTGTTKGFLDDNGFLSKAAERANDLFGLWGGFELKKAEIEAMQNDRNPVIEESQRRAGLMPTLSGNSKLPLYIAGGVAALSAIGLFFALNQK